MDGQASAAAATATTPLIKPFPARSIDASVATPASTVVKKTHTTTTTTTTTTVATTLAGESPVIELLDDSFEDNRKMAAVVPERPPNNSQNVVDLFSKDSTPLLPRRSRRSKRKDAPPAAAAAASSIIELLDDEEDNHAVAVATNEAAAPTAAAAASSARKRPRIDSNSMIQKVLEVLPNTDQNLVETLLKQHNNSVDAVVNQLLTGEVAAPAVAAAAAAAATPSQPMAVEMKNGTVTTLRRERKTWSCDFMAPSSFRPSDAYVVEAAATLLNEFPFLSKSGADRILLGEKAGQRHYAVAYEAILKVIKGEKPKGGTELLELQYQRYQDAMNGTRLNLEQERALTDLAPGRNHIVRPRKRNSSSAKMPAKPPTVTDPILVEELQYVQEKMAEWTEMAERNATIKRNQKIAQDANTAIDCLVCYESYAMDDMCQCHEGHLCCCLCLENQAKAHVFGNGNLGPADKDKKPATQLTCIVECDCKAGFSRAILEKALPRKTLEKHDELLSQIAIACAGFANVAKCPKCNYQAELANEGQTYFKCSMEDCQFESCQGCNLKWHGDKISCDEAQRQEHAAGGRHKVEEAMSAAKIRACPKCQKPFLKETGCNKITCGCGALSCYICRKLIPASEGYAHFCQRPHCQHKDKDKDCGGKCPLWTKDEEKEDAKHMRKAGLEAVEGEEGIENKVVDQLLRKTPTKGKRKSHG